MTVPYRPVVLVSLLSKEIEVSSYCICISRVCCFYFFTHTRIQWCIHLHNIKASGGTLFPHGRVGGDGIGSISSPVKVKDMASVFAFGIDSGGGSCHVDGGPFDTKVWVVYVYRSKYSMLPCGSYHIDIVLNHIHHISSLLSSHASFYIYTRSTHTHPIFIVTFEDRLSW